MEQAPDIETTQHHDAARRVLRAGRIRSQKADDAAPTLGDQAESRKPSWPLLLALGAATGLAIVGTASAVFAGWVPLPGGTGDLAQIAPRPAEMPISPLPHVAPEASHDLASPPGPLPMPGQGTLSPSDLPSAAPMELQIGELRLRVRGVLLDTAAGAPSSARIGLHVLNLTATNLDLQRGDILLGSCAGSLGQNTPGAVKNLADVISIERDCILRLRNGTSHRVLLEQGMHND